MRPHIETSLSDSLAKLRHLNEHETAALLNLSVKTLRRHRFNGTGIPFHKTGRRVSYSLPARPGLPVIESKLETRKGIKGSCGGCRVKASGPVQKTVTRAQLSKRVELFRNLIFSKSLRNINALDHGRLSYVDSNVEYIIGTPGKSHTIQ